MSEKKDSSLPHIDHWLDEIEDWSFIEAGYYKYKNFIIDVNLFNGEKFVLIKDEELWFVIEKDKEKWSDIRSPCFKIEKTNLKITEEKELIDLRLELIEVIRRVIQIEKGLVNRIAGISGNFNPNTGGANSYKKPNGHMSLSEMNRMLN